MAYRYTVNDLRMAIAGLNRSLGFPETGTITTADGRWESVPGAYALDSAYGGWRLVQYVGSGGGERDITPRATIRGAYDLIWAYRHGVEAGMQAESMAREAAAGI